MCAYAVLKPLPSSHPFQERRIGLNEVIKVGRAVARAKPAVGNGIFDCKVLSRNHANLWFQEGKFFLQDTKSSNGTFVNQQRLCPSNEESPPHQIFSGDLLQFGVEVVENQKGITHGCVIAEIRLFHSDGVEAVPENSPPGRNENGVNAQEAVQLTYFIREALHRDAVLEQKLATLQKFVDETQAAADLSWRAAVDQERLLARIEHLEELLALRAVPQEARSLTDVQDELFRVGETSREALAQLLEEKTSAVSRLSILERSLTAAETECQFLREQFDSSQAELLALTVGHQEASKELRELREKVKEAHGDYKSSYERAIKEKEELENRIAEMLRNENALNARIESLQVDKAESDFAAKQLSAFRARVAENESITEPLEWRDKLDECQRELEKFQSMFDTAEKRLDEKRVEVERLEVTLHDAEMRDAAKQAQIEALEERLHWHDVQINQLIENAMADLKVQLNEARRQTEATAVAADHLRAHLSSLCAKLNVPVDEGEEFWLPLEERISALLGAEEESRRLQEQLKLMAKHTESVADERRAAIEQEQTLKEEICVLRNGLHNDIGEEQNAYIAEQKTQSAFEQVERARLVSDKEALRVQLGETECRLAVSEEMCREREHFKVRCYELETIVKSLQSREHLLDCSVRKLEEQLERSKLDSKARHDELDVLRGRLEERESAYNSMETELRRTLTDLEEARERLHAVSEHMVMSKGPSLDGGSDVLNKKSLIQCLSEQLRKAEALVSEVDNGSLSPLSASLDLLCNRLELDEQAAESMRDELQTQRRENEKLKAQLAEIISSPVNEQSDQRKSEFVAVRHECAALRQRVQALEDEMHLIREEKQNLLDSNSQLHQANEELGETLANRELNLTDTQKHYEQMKSELESSRRRVATLEHELQTLQSQCSEQENTIVLLQAQCVELRAQLAQSGGGGGGGESQGTTMEEVVQVQDRFRWVTVTACVLFVATLLAMFPLTTSP